MFGFTDAYSAWTHKHNTIYNKRKVPYISYTVGQCHLRRLGKILAFIPALTLKTCVAFSALLFGWYDWFFLVYAQHSYKLDTCKITDARAKYFLVTMCKHFPSSYHVVQ